MIKLEEMAPNGTVFGLSVDFIIEQIESYKRELKRLEIWELEMELHAQATAHERTRIYIVNMTPNDPETFAYQADLMLIVHRIAAIGEEIKRRFIP